MAALSASSTTSHVETFFRLASSRTPSITSRPIQTSKRRHCSAISLARCFWTRSFVVIFPLMIPIGLLTDSPLGNVPEKLIKLIVFQFDGLI